MIQSLITKKVIEVVTNKWTYKIYRLKSDNIHYEITYRNPIFRNKTTLILIKYPMQRLLF